MQDVHHVLLRLPLRAKRMSEAGSLAYAQLDGSTVEWLLEHGLIQEERQAIITAQCKHSYYEYANRQPGQLKDNGSWILNRCLKYYYEHVANNNG